MLFFGSQSDADRFVRDLKDHLAPFVGGIYAALPDKTASSLSALIVMNHVVDVHTAFGDKPMFGLEKTIIVCNDHRYDVVADTAQLFALKAARRECPLHPPCGDMVFVQ